MGGFNNRQEGAAPSQVDQESEVHLSRIAFLGERKSELESSVAHLESLNLSSEELELAVAKSKDELAGLEVDITAKRQESDELTETNIKLLNEKVTLVDSIAKAKATRDAEAASFDATLEAKKAELASLTQSIVDKTKEEARAKESADAATANEAECLRNLAATEEKAHSQIATLASNIAEKEAYWTELYDKSVAGSSDLKAVKSEIATLEAKAAGLDVVINARLEEASTKAQTIIAAAEAKQAAVDEKEVEVIARESIIEEKTTQLKRAKADLEVAFNRPITHIKF